MKIKVCGLTDNASGIHVASLAEVDFLGFIFHQESPRHTEMSFDTDKKKVGVFVNARLSTICSHIETHGLASVQLHGNEPADLLRQLPSEITIIKAFGIASETDFDQCEAFEGLADFFLFDTKSTSHGGSGTSFDWNLLQQYTGTTPFFLSGGLSLENISQLKQLNHPQLYGLDLNSCFEQTPMVKDCFLIQQFIQQLHS